MKKILKYIFIFFIILSIYITCQLATISIPNKWIEKNILETVEYYEGKKNHETLFDLQTDSKYFNNTILIDNYVDTLTLNMIWNANKNPNIIDAQINMDFYFEKATMSENLVKTVKDNKPSNIEYSRYWHGSIIYIKPLLIFFNIKEIIIINIIISLILTTYLVFLIYKKSKKLGIIFLLGLISIFSFMFPLCFQYYFAYLIMLISSIITMKTLNKKDKTFYINMIITGVSVCFMDFLTCETLTLTIPLLLRLYFSKANKSLKEKLLFIFKSCLAWGLSYVFTFVLKWLVSIIYLGPQQFKITWNKAKIRIYDLPIEKTPKLIPQSLLKVFNLIFPISIFKSAPLVSIIYIAITLWSYIFCLNKQTKKKYNCLILVSLIPIIRILVLYAHTLGHYYFDYRALLPFIIITILIIFDGIKNELKNMKGTKNE